MEFNCYFPTEPTMYKWSVTNIFDRLVKQLCILYPEHNFNIIHSPLHCEQLGINIHQPGKKFGYSMMIVENSSNKKYHLINYCDKLNGLNEKNHWDLENLVDVYSSTGAHIDHTYFKPLNIKYIPISYPVNNYRLEYILSTRNHNFDKKIVNDRPFFRGNVYKGFREFVLTDNRFDVVATNHYRTNKLGIYEYANEINQNTISVCFDGVGETTHRDIESFGVGAAVMRRILTNQFYDKLIPDYHYIGIETDDIIDLPLEQYHKLLADKFYEKYQSVKNNVEYLKYIGKNGYEWYINNGTIDANVNILLKLVDIKKLL